MSNEKREQQMMDAADRYADEVCDESCTGAQVAQMWVLKIVNFLLNTRRAGYDIDLCNFSHYCAMDVLVVLR